MSWQDILENPEFQKQPYEIKKEVAESYFNDKIANNPDLSNQPKQVQDEVRASFFDTIASDATWGETVKSWPGQIKGAAQRVAGGAIRAIGEMPEDQFPTPKSVEPTPLFKPEVLAEAGTSLYKAGVKSGEKATEGKRFSIAQELATGTAVNLVQNSALMALTILNPTVGFTAFGATALSEEYGKMREAGFSQAESMGAGAIYGAAEMYFEKRSLGTWALAKSVKHRMFQALKSEVWTEEATELVQTAVDVMSVDFQKVKKMYEEGDVSGAAKWLGWRMIETAAVTALSVPFLSGGASLIHKLTGAIKESGDKNAVNDILIKKVEDAVKKGDKAEAFVATAELLKSNANNPAVSDNLVKKITELTEKKVEEKVKEEAKAQPQAEAVQKETKPKEVVPSPPKEAQQPPLPAVEPPPATAKTEPKIIYRNTIEGGKVDTEVGYRGVPQGGYHTTQEDYGAEKPGATRWEALDKSEKPLIWESAKAQAIRDKVGYKTDYLAEGEIAPPELNQKMNEEIVKAGYDSIVVEGGKEIGLMTSPNNYFSDKQTYNQVKQNIELGEHQLVVGDKTGKDVGRIKFDDGGNITLIEGNVDKNDVTEFVKAKYKIDLSKPHPVRTAKTEAVKAKPVETKPEAKPVTEAPAESFGEEIDRIKAKAEGKPVAKPVTKVAPLTKEEKVIAKKYSNQVYPNIKFENLNPEAQQKMYKEALVNLPGQKQEKSDAKLDAFVVEDTESLEELQEKEHEGFLDNEEGAIDIDKIGKVPKDIANALLESINRFKEMGMSEDEVTGAVKGLHWQNQQFQSWFMTFAGQFLPQDLIMRHPVARKTYEAAMKFTEGNQVYRYKIIEQELVPLLKSIPKDMKPHMSDYLEGKKTIPNEAKTHVDSVRKYLDFLHDFATAHGLELGYLHDYLPHFFDNYAVKIKSGGLESSADGYDHREFYKTMDEAVVRAFELEKQGYGIEYVGPTVTPDIYDVRVSNKKMAAMILNLQKDFTMQWGEIKQILRESGVKQLPKDYFASFFTKRVTNNPNYIKDIDTILELYSHKLIRKITVDSFRQAVQSDIEKLQSQELRSSLNHYVDSVIYTPSWTAKAIARTLQSFGVNTDEFQVRSAVGNIALAQYAWDMAGLVSSAFTNSTQLALNTGSLLGFSRVSVASKAGTQALIDLKFKGGKSALAQELINTGIIEEALTTAEYANLRGEGWIKGGAKLGLALFTTVEQFNRVTSYIASKSYAQSKGKEASLKILDLMLVPQSAEVRSLTEEKFNVAFAKEMVNQTQFRGEAFNSPKLLNSPVAGIIAPYKKFLVNQSVFQYKLIHALIGGNSEAWKALMRFMGLSFLLAGWKANQLTGILGWVADKSIKAASNQSLYDTELAGIPIGEILEKGLPTLGGLDMTSAIALENPFADNFYNRNKHWTEKVTGGALIRMAQATNAVIKGDTETLMRLTTPRFVKKFNQGYAIFAHHDYRDSAGNLVADNVLNTEGVKSLLGLVPKVVMEEYRRKEANTQITDWYNKEVVDVVDDWADKVQQGKLEQAEIYINQLVAKAEKLFKQYEDAKPGKYKDELGKKVEMIADALDSERLFDEAIDKKFVPSMLRERRKAFKAEGVEDYLKSQE